MKALKAIFLSVLFITNLSVFAGNTQPGTKVTQIDTLLIRLNNHPYYTIKVNGQPPIYDGHITFYPLRVTDTGTISLKCLDSKSQLIKMMRNGDTIQNYFFGNIKLSFTDFTDSVQKKKAKSNIFSHRILFYNCVFGHVTADTTEDQYA
jgi:hypothetical protein